MLDELDRKIVGILQYDGRIPYTTIAEKLDVTEGAVRRRVKRMMESGKLQIVAVAEPEELGLTEGGMIGINIEANKISEVGEAIALIGFFFSTQQHLANLPPVRREKLR